LGKAFLAAFDEIKDKFNSFVEKLKNFFRGFITGTVFECVKIVGDKVLKITKVALGIRSKIVSFQLVISLHGPGITLWVIDFVIALLCAYDKIIGVINSFDISVKSTGPDGTNTRFYYFGKGIGILLQVSSTSLTFAGSLLKLMKPAKALKKLN